MVGFVSLSQVPAGRAANVVRIEGADADVRRLEEFGLYEGAHCKVFRSGNPCLVTVYGSKLCVREDARLKVFVKPIDA